MVKFQQSWTNKWVFEIKSKSLDNMMIEQNSISLEKTLNKIRWSIKKSWKNSLKR